MASSLSDLREKQSSVKEVAQKKRKVQEEATTSSRGILRELQQVDNNIGTRDTETVESLANEPVGKKPAARKAMERKAPAKSKPARAPAKRVTKTKETKRMEESVHQRSFEDVMERVERVAQRKANEKKAAKEERERARREKEEEEEARRVKEAAAAEPEIHTGNGLSDSEDEIPLIERKRAKAKVTDWNFQVGASELADGGEGEEEVMTRESYSLDNDLREEDELPQIEIPPSKKVKKVSKKQGPKVIAKQEEGYIVLSSDEEEPTALHTEADVEVQSLAYDDHTRSRYHNDFEMEVYDEYSMMDPFANYEVVASDWPQDGGLQPDYYQEEAIAETQSDKVKMDDEDDYCPTGLLLPLPRESPTRSRRVDEEVPLFLAPPTSPSPEIDMIFTRDPLEELEPNPDHFDDEYIRQLLHGED
jgi:hypothetical protein